MIIKSRENFYGFIGFNGTINLSSLNAMGIPTTDPLESQYFYLYLRPNQQVTVEDKWFPLQNIQAAINLTYITIADYPSKIKSLEKYTNNYSLTKVEILNTPDYPAEIYEKYNSNFDKLDGIIYSMNSGGGGGSWGEIDGNLDDQTDLKIKLNSKANVYGQIFSGNIYAPNLSGENTGDQNLTPYLTVSNATLTYQPIGTYLTTETDPIFTASNAHSITLQDIQKLSNTSGINTGDETNLTILNKLGTTGVSAHNYTNTNLSVDAYGRIISASNGSSSGSETDPVFTSSNAFNITANDIINIHNLPTDISGLVTKTTTVNGHQLSSNVSVTKYDIGLGAVANIDTTITSNITDSTNKRFVTDSELVVLSNTIGINTGDETNATILSKLGNTSVVAGSYTNTNLTVDAYGRLVSAANGSAGSLEHNLLSNLDYSNSGHTGFQSEIITGTSNQYLKGDLSLGTFPANVSSFVNDSEYIKLTSLREGVGISYNNSTGVITNIAPNQIVSLANGTSIGITGTYPSFTVNNLNPDQTVSISGSSHVSVGGSYPSFTLTDTAIDKTNISSVAPIVYSNVSGQISWTNSNNYIAKTDLSATSPINYSNTTGVISFSNPGYILSGSNVSALNNDIPYATVSNVHSVISGGTTNQVLSKNSNTDYDLKWSNVAWGIITGDITSQTDLQTSLNTKANVSGQTFTGNIGITANSASITITSPDDSNNTAELKRVAASRALTLKNYVGTPSVSAQSITNYGTGAVALSAPSSAFPVATGTYTTWFYITSNPSSDVNLYAKGDLSTFITLVLRTTGVLDYYTAAYSDWRITSTAVSLSGWHNVTIRWMTNSAEMWLDGFIVGSKDTSNNTVPSNTYLLMPGFNGTWSSGSGYQDETATWNRYLTDNEVRDIYNTGNGLYLVPSNTFPSSGTLISTNLLGLWHFDGVLTDSSGNGFTITATNTAYNSSIYKTVGSSSASQGTLFNYIDGVSAGEKGIAYLGDASSRTVIQGLTTRFNIGGVEKGQITSTAFTYAQQNIITGSSDAVQLLVKGNATQTNHLQDWANSAGTVLASIGGTGTVNLRTGSTTAGTSPLKFVSGDLMSVSEAGAVEFNLDDYYVTITSPNAYTSQYPTGQSSTYVKASVDNGSGYYAYLATDPTKSLTGSWTGNSWMVGAYTSLPQRVNIDYGTAKTFNRIYYENNHSSGSNTDWAFQNYTVWGTNSGTAFADTTVLSDANMVAAGWTQIGGTYTFAQHIALDQSDPQYQLLTNSNAYRYMCVKILSIYGSAANYPGIRRIEFQINPGAGRNPIVQANSTQLTSGRVPYATTNGRLNDSSTLTYSATTGLATTKPITLTGSTDAVQLKVIANATQTNDVFQILASDGTTVRLSVDSKGYLKILNSTGANNVWIAGGTSGVPSSLTGNYNTVIGDNALKAGTSANKNLVIGQQAGGLLSSGANNVFLGYSAGYRQTTNNNLLIIDNQDRSTAAAEATNSLVYGVFNATPSSQTLTTNVGTFSVSGGGTSQSTITRGLAVNTGLVSGATGQFVAKGSVDQNLLVTDTVNDRLGVGTGSPTVKLDVNGSVKLGGSSTDTITATGRLIVRSVAADPTANATAGTIAEIVYYNNKFYGKITTTGTDTNWSALN